MGQLYGRPARVPHERKGDSIDYYTRYQQRIPYSSAQDIGIGVVGARTDGGYVAVRCKLRRLDECGNGQGIAKHEIDSFISASDNSLWKERRLVTNGSNWPARNVVNTTESAEPPVQIINIKHDLTQQQTSESQGLRTSKDDMQKEAVRVSAANLREHFALNSNEIPKGGREAR